MIEKLTEERYRDIIRGKASNVTPLEISLAAKDAYHYGTANASYFLRHHYPKECNMAREQYHLRERCKDIGLNPDEHELRFEYYQRKKVVVIDGYWILVYRLLFVTDPKKAKMCHLTKAIRYLQARGDDESLVLLYLRYESLFEKREQHFREMHGLADDVEIESIDALRVNGLRVKLWLSLNDENYVPDRTMLIKRISSLEENGEPGKAAFLRIKYKELLEPKKDELPSMEHSDAQSFRSYILSPEYRQKLIQRSRERCENATDN